MSQAHLSIHKRIENFRPARGRMDYSLLEHGPRLVLAQLIVTGLTLLLATLYPPYEWITWGVWSPVYALGLLILFAEAWVLRSFLKKIPATFLHLWDEDVVQKGEVESTLGKFLERFEQRLNSRQRLLLGLPFAFLGLVFFWNSGHLPYVIQRSQDGSDLALKIVVITVNTLALFLPAAVVGYALGIGLWKSLVTALYVRRFGRDFQLVIRPAHPDKAGGLSPLGNLIFSIAALLVVACLALSGMILISRYTMFPNTEFYSKISLGVALVLSLILFFLPLLTTHRRMVAERERSRPMLRDIVHRIAELEDSAQVGFRAMNHKKREEVFSEIKSLTTLYNHSAQAPTWPFNREILLKFATPQIFSLLTLAGVAQPIVSAIQSLL